VGRTRNHALVLNTIICEKKVKQEAKDVSPNINRTQAAKRAEKCRFCPGDLDLWPLTLTFKLVRARDQTRLSCELGANPFSGSPDISYTNKKLPTDGVKNRTFRSSLRAVIKHHSYTVFMFIWNLERVLHHKSISALQIQRQMRCIPEMAKNKWRKRPFLWHHRDNKRPRTTTKPTHLHGWSNEMI